MVQTRNRQLALDMSQETFAKTWQYLINGNTVRNTKAFLLRTAKNSIIDHARKKKAQSLDELLESGFDYTLDEKEEETQAEHIDAKQIRACLDALPSPYREVLQLRFVEDLTLSEIAKITGETRNSISVRVHRALGKLKIHMREQGLL